MITEGTAAALLREGWGFQTTMGGATIVFDGMVTPAELAMPGISEIELNRLLKRFIGYRNAVRKRGGSDLEAAASHTFRDHASQMREESA